MFAFIVDFFYIQYYTMYMINCSWCFLFASMKIICLTTLIRLNT